MNYGSEEMGSNRCQFHGELAGAGSSASNQQLMCDLYHCTLRTQAAGYLLIPWEIIPQSTGFIDDFLPGAPSSSLFSFIQFLLIIYR